MREYTIQYLLDYDWHRVDAVYSNLEDALYHANNLITDGKIIRLLARDFKKSSWASAMWYTVRLGSDNKVYLDYKVPSCPV